MGRLGLKWLGLWMSFRFGSGASGTLAPAGGGVVKLLTTSPISSKNQIILSFYFFRLSVKPPWSPFEKVEECVKISFLLS